MVAAGAATGTVYRKYSTVLYGMHSGLLVGIRATVPLATSTDTVGASYLGVGVCLAVPDAPA